MKRTIFLYSGEGTHGGETGLGFFKQSARWRQIEEILSDKLELNLEQIWEREIGRHRCPYSPLLTVVAQICLSDIWVRWGYRPDVTLGHSTGELAAAFQAGLYSLEDVLLLAHGIGTVAANLDGSMLHGRLSNDQIAGLRVNLSSVNFEIQGDKHVTLSGYPSEMTDFQTQHPEFVQMKLPHPWHHPDYGR